MCRCNRKILRLLIFFVCFIYYKLGISDALVIRELTRSVVYHKQEAKELVKRQYVFPTTITVSTAKSSVKFPFQENHKPVASDDSQIFRIPNINLKGHLDKKEETAKLISQLRDNKADKREANTYKPSVIGSIFLYLITLVVAGSLFVMLACFMHKWRENMGSNTNYPKVEYSMLRQGEDEPEDPMGEILVNIGLALPEDIRHVSDTDSETDESKITSLEPSYVEPTQNEFTNIPLDQEDSVHLLSKHHHDESDEELLQ